ncbi:UNVERIFIED_CONTAM: DNA-binding CsgD family transcriptional regulator [Brevibacillus sp. OAP136]
MDSMSMEKRSRLIEEVCEKCPATCWGQKSMCNVHNLHVGKIESCPEWEKLGEAVAEHATSAIDRTDGVVQAAKVAFDSYTDMVMRAEEEIKDYSFNLREIERIRLSLEEVGGSLGSAYGIEAALPNGKGTTSDKTQREVVRRERNQKRLQKLTESILRVEQAMEGIASERERIVLECIMEGMRMNVIAKHLGISRSHFHEMKRNVIKKMALAMYGNDQLQAG